MSVSVEFLPFKDVLAPQFRLKQRTARIFRHGMVYQAPSRNGELLAKKARNSAALRQESPGGPQPCILVFCIFHCSFLFFLGNIDLLGVQKTQENMFKHDL